MRKQATRLAVQKTYKLFIGGKFARSESGRIIAARDAEGRVLANYCRASRKDFRDAVRAALMKARPVPQFAIEIGAHPTASPSLAGTRNASP